MEKDRLFEDILTFQDSNDKDELLMIVSNNMDIVYDGDGAVSVKKWGDLVADILRWHARKMKIKTGDRKALPDSIYGDNHPCP